MGIVVDMEEQHTEETQTNGSMMYYVIGAVVLAAIAGGVYFLRPKTTNAPVQTGNEVVTPIVEVSPTPGPIVGLACERQWYNPVVGFPKYFIGVEGADLMTTKKVMCNFSVSVAGKVVATTSAQSSLTQDVARGGGIFRCDSPSLELEANVPTVVDVLLKNDSNQTASCTQTFVLPQP